MMIDILNKLFLFLFLLSTLNIIRNVFFLIRTIVDKERFTLEKGELTILGISIAYVLLILIDGVNL